VEEGAIMDFLSLLYSFLKAILWALVGAIAMSLSMGILLKVYDVMTPINEWEEIKKGNLATAILMAAVILSYGIVIAAIMIAP